MLTALVIVALLLALAVGLIVLALVTPIRIGVRVRGDDRLSEARGGVRFYGGVFGVGASMDRGSFEQPTPPVVTVGAMLWRWFIPVRKVYPAAPRAEPAVHEQPARPPEVWRPAPEPEMAIDEPALDAVTPDDATQAQAPDDIELAPTPPDEGPTEIERKPTGETGPVEAPAVVPDRASAPDAAPGWYEKLTLQWRVFRGYWSEWSPVAKNVLKRLRGIVAIRKLAVDGQVGLHDPALTAQAVGFAMALSATDTVGVRLSGVYDGSLVLRGSAQAEIRISMRRIWSAALYVGWIAFRYWRSTRRATSQQSGEGQGG